MDGFGLPGAPRTQHGRASAIGPAVAGGAPALQGDSTHGGVLLRWGGRVPARATEPAIEVQSGARLLVMAGTIRVLLIADTHLGFDLPQRVTRSARDRRGEEFFASYERALEPAIRGEVDLVVHGGDVFFRSRVKPGLVLRAFAPLKRVADRGVPIFVVPGNHERSAIPFPLLAAHPGIHLFDRPRTFSVSFRGVSVAVSGFPCERQGIRDSFAGLLARSEWSSVAAGLRLLVIHQSVEGATVGSAGFTFRGGPDVIPGGAIPSGFAAVLAGHIHRHQVLTRDLAGRPLRAPVFYPGSIARTSSAENCDAKGSLVLELTPDSDGGRAVRWEFRRHEASVVVPYRGSADESRFSGAFRL